jgi:hypothetical protein
LGTATNWIFNFMVVEITPVGISSLHWKFYIIWTIFNASFVPIVWLFYPETAGRTLEDLDRFFTENQKVILAWEPEAISGKRPERYRLKQEEEVRRNSSVRQQSVAAALERRRVVDRTDGDDGLDEAEKGSVEKFE